MNASLSGCSAAMPYGYQPRLKWLYIAIEFIIAALAITGNLLVCLAVTRNRKLRTVTNYFLVSLAVADILVGLVAIPSAALTDVGQPHHNMPLCLVLLSILLVLTQSSILSLLAVAAERYIAILLPFQYQRVMSPRNAWLAVLLTWGLGAISGCVPLMDWRRQPADSVYCIFTCVVDMSYLVYFNFFCFLLLPLAAMLVIYSQIFLTVRSQLRRIAVVTAAARDEDVGSAREGVGGGAATGKGTESKCEEAKVGREAGGRGLKVGGEWSSVQSVISTDATAIFSNSALGPRGPNLARTRARTCHELRKAHSLFLILFLFIVCWFPIHLINCVLLFCPQCKVPMTPTLGAILLSHANSAINPILYAYRMRSFRRTLIAMWSFRPKCP